MLKARRYEILRQVDARSRTSLELPENPVRVATIINEKDFLEGGCVLRHNRNVFLEDRQHDWSWKNGQFRYFTRIADVADVLIIYELDG